LENPLQISAFDYPKEYSVKSPKFARAMAVRVGNHVTTWVSGTASIVNAETVHKGDAMKQTEQTLTNIEKLIAPENFARHGWADAGATLADLAKIHVYVKHPEDFDKVRAGLRAPSGPSARHLCGGGCVPPRSARRNRGSSLLLHPPAQPSDLMTCYENHPTPVGTDGQHTVG
jgi:enamine deaminase RidA (YjgF/YER057c/UK114 family)